MRESRLNTTGISAGEEVASCATRHEAGLFNHASPCRPNHLNSISLLLAVTVGTWFWVPLTKLFTLASENEHFSHLVVVPVLVFYLLSSKKAALLSSRMWSPFVGLSVMLGGAICYLLVDGATWGKDRLTIEIVAFVVVCWGLFLFTFGHKNFRDNLFALALLLFMIPLPPVLLDTIIVFLQRSSANTVDVLFSTLGIRALRDGFTFELTNFIIFIEEECSGIRSFFALIITSLLAGHWFLRSWWARAVLVAVVVPLAIIKNAFRIVGLSLLANAIDPVFLLDSVLHRYGGIPLFVLSFAVLICITWLLHKLERRFECGLHHGSRAQA